MKRTLTTSLTALALTVLALATGASAAFAQTPAPMTTTQMTTTQAAPSDSRMVAATQARVGDIQPVRNEAELRAGLIGPGTTSLMSSKMALNKATHPKIMEFAMFETDEQTSLGMVLKELNTPDAPMSAKDAALLKRLETAAKGRDFDTAYAAGQIEGHQMLLMVTESYLRNADLKSTDPKEMEARHLAYMLRSVVKQHIANTTELMAMVK